LNEDFGGLAERMKNTLDGAAKIVAPKEEDSDEEL
jgi:hypothetical protein